MYVLLYINVHTTSPLVIVTANHIGLSAPPGSPTPPHKVYESSAPKKQWRYANRPSTGALYTKVFGKIKEQFAPTSVTADFEEAPDAHGSPASVR